MKVVPEAGEAEQSREFSLSCVVTMATDEIQIMRRLEGGGLVVGTLALNSHAHKSSTSSFSILLR